MSATADCWGDGSFDNLAAHDLAFHVVTRSPDLAEVLSELSSSADDLRKHIAVGELLNALRGHLDSVENAPALGEWVLENPQDPSVEMVHGVADRIEAAAAASPLRQWWGRQGEEALQGWLRNVEACLTRLRSSRRGRKSKLTELSKPALLRLVKKRFPEREPNLCYEMYSGKSYKGYPQLHLQVNFIDTPTAAEMARSRSVVSLAWDIEHQEADAAMLTPMKLLLRSWWRRIRRFSTDVPDKKHRSNLLKNLKWELSNLPQLEVFGPECFLVDDGVIEAIAANSNLRELVVRKGEEATNKSLDILAKCPNVKVVQFWHSKITKRKAEAFARSHPEKKVSIVD